MNGKAKLELTWIGKENRPKLEPRVLIEDPERSYHAKFRVKANGTADDADERRSDTENLRKSAPSAVGVGDLFDNRLIFGDNLLALKALEQEFTGKIKCIYIDPPYNTGSAFTHYDDGIEHSLWLSLMRDRLELLRRLLSEDGSIWVSIDDNEQAYLRVMMDEIFGRANFVCNVVWEKKYSPQPNAIWLSDSHDYLAVFAKEKSVWRPFALPRTDEMDNRYKNPDNDPRGQWKAQDFTISLTGGQRGAQFARTGESANIYEITTPSGRKLLPIRGRCWGAAPKRFAELVAENRIWFGESGNNVPALKKFLSEVQDKNVAKTIWFRSDVGDNQDAKREAAAFNADEIFSTPKPERLIQRVLSLATKPGELVLDSFAGSGTTGAVAHKMGRKWIMVELGEHCHTHIIPRMKKVIDGQDPGGITDTVNWKGGGGFRYYRVGPSLLKKDKFDHWVISPEFNDTLLAQAVCKLEGFTYAPSDSIYWQHGHSTENDFIYVTTQTLTHDMLTQLSDEVGENRSLLVVCKAFTCKPAFANLTVKKIPKAVLAKCEWGHDDYSLEIQNLPMQESEKATADGADVRRSENGEKKSRKFGKGNTKMQEPMLFKLGEKISE